MQFACDQIVMTCWQELTFRMIANLSWRAGGWARCDRLLQRDPTHPHLHVKAGFTHVHFLHRALGLYLLSSEISGVVAKKTYPTVRQDHLSPISKRHVLIVQWSQLVLTNHELLYFLKCVMAVLNVIRQVVWYSIWKPPVHTDAMADGFWLCMFEFQSDSELKKWSNI